MAAGLGWNLFQMRNSRARRAHRSTDDPSAATARMPPGHTSPRSTARNTVTTSYACPRMIFGRHIYAMGGNLQAAKLSSVNTKRVNTLLLVNMVLLSAVPPGIVYSARSNSAQPGAGNMFKLDVIAAASSAAPWPRVVSARCRARSSVA